MGYLYTFILILWTNTLLAYGQEQGDVRLRGRGSNSTQGRVEIYYQGQWGTVCDDAFETADASVVCRQLGHSPDFATVLGGVFGAGTGPILLDNVGCTGTETRLEQCQHNGWGQYNCDHSEDVGVRCQPKATAPATPVVPTTTKAPTVVQDSNCTTPDDKIRLVGPSNQPWVGVVQVFSNNQWGGICDNGWGLDNAKVVCRSLCFDANKAVPGSETFDTTNITQPMTVKKVNCGGTETSIVDCARSTWVPSGGQCRRTEMAKVTCGDWDNSAPARPDPIMSCSNGMISASFSTITDPYLQPRHLSVNMSYTGPCGVEITNTTDFITISVPFDECGTQATTNATHITYKTQIRYQSTHSSGSISHANTYIFKTDCVLPKSIEDPGKPIVPLTETVTKTAEGRFQVSMQFFRNSLYEPPVQKYPLEVPLGEYLSSSIQLNDVDSNLRLIVPSCYATPSNDREDSPKYSLFSNKCKDDGTVMFIPLNSTVFAFRYQTFKFRDYPEIHIHCDAMVCRQEEEDPECDRSCLPTTTAATTTNAQSGGRRRRSIGHDIIHVSSGTMRVYDPNRPSSEIIREPDSDVQTAANQKTSVSTVTEAQSEQTLRPPYLGEIETVLTGDGSGATTIIAFNIYILCIVVFVVFAYI